MASIIHNVSGLTNDFNQSINIDLDFLEKEESIQINLQYHESTADWRYDLIVYDANRDIIKQTMGNVLKYNLFLISEYINVLGFGIGCVTNDGFDPYSDTAFTDGNASDANYGFIIYNKDGYDELMKNLMN